METNLLYYGDNLDILKRYMEDESIDLVYLDPPFNSSQNYNVLFDEKDGSKSASQIRAFEDTWHWNLDSQKEFESIVLRADKGIDGRILFFESPSNKKAKQIIISVKSGKVSSSHIRDLKGVLEREKAAIGVYITLNPPTRDMNEEAANAGFYRSGELGTASYPKIQILTIKELLNGKTISSPSYMRDREGNRTFKRAPKGERLKKERNNSVTLNKFIEERA